MASNRSDTSHLRLDEEMRSIQENIHKSDYYDSNDFQSRWVIRSSDILHSINQTHPTIIHFSGHGSEYGGLVLENSDGSLKLVTKEIITATITTASDTVQLVVFNACFSEILAKNIVSNIDLAIGMSTAIGDKAACFFAAQLYSSIAFRKNLQNPFDQAIVALSLAEISEEDTPKIYKKEEINLNEIILVNPNI